MAKGFLSLLVYSRIWRRGKRMAVDLNSEDVQPLYRLVDVGVNLLHPNFAADLDRVIERAQKAGVVKMMVTGCNVDQSRECLELAKTRPQLLYSTAGVHPHDAKDFTADSITDLEKMAAHSQCVAIGECGLDFNRNFSPRDRQIAAFEAQVKLACKLGKPLFIHEREAHDVIVDILSKHKEQLPPTVMHCFTGFANEAQKYIEMGLNIGLTGFLWKDRSENGVQFALKNRLIPVERLVIETDAPFMYPNVKNRKFPGSVREKIGSRSLSLLKNHCSFERNEPCSLPTTLEMIAAFMDICPQQLALKTTENAMRIYQLS